ncbi:MAG: NAD(P)H-dependent oxidoreductase [Sulfuricellaceae bacterium]|nr:NAD(P)H-dependent oxidoreductase [Sulfuricellaceae bacterium]
MSRLLRIDASSRTSGSYSREMADFFQQAWFKAHPGDEIVVRDLAAYPLPHIAEQTIAGFYTPGEQHDDALKAATALSDELIKELLAADVLIISAPMYNFSLPSALKAYIDQIVRINHTFAIDPEKGFQGLVSGKRAYIFTAYGAVFSNEAMAAYDFFTPYLKFLLGFLGITASEFFPVEGTTLDEAALVHSKNTAKKRIEALFRS